MPKKKPAGSAEAIEESKRFVTLLKDCAQITKQKGGLSSGVERLRVKEKKKVSFGSPRAGGNLRMVSPGHGENEFSFFLRGTRLSARGERAMSELYKVVA